MIRELQRLGNTHCLSVSECNTQCYILHMVCARGSRDLVFSPLCSLVVSEEKDFSIWHTELLWKWCFCLLLAWRTNVYSGTQTYDNHDEGLSCSYFYVHQKYTSSLVVESSGV